VTLPSIRPIAALVSAAVAVATIWAGNPSAFALNGTSWPQPQTFYVVNAANLDLASDAADAAVRAGAAVWQQQSGAFRFAYAGPSTLAVTGNDAINLVLFRNASSGSAIATTYWWSSGSRIIDADIVFWDAAFKFFAGSSGCAGGFYIEDIAAHEFGHALGLGHSTSPAATMYPSAASCDTGLRALDADDIAGVRALYPSTQPPPTPPTGLRIVGVGP
jgi:hypothetical protein